MVHYEFANRPVIRMTNDKPTKLTRDGSLAFSVVYKILTFNLLLLTRVQRSIIKMESLKYFGDIVHFCKITIREQIVIFLLLWTGVNNCTY